MFGGLGRKAKQAKVLYLCRKLGRSKVVLGKFGGLGRQAKQVKVLYLCRKAGPRPGGSVQVWWTWTTGDAGHSWTRDSDGTTHYMRGGQPGAFPSLPSVPEQLVLEHEPGVGTIEDMDVDEFVKTFLEPDEEDGPYKVRGKPCPFLGDDDQSAPLKWATSSMRG